MALSRLAVSFVLWLLGLFLMWQIPTLTRKGRGGLRRRAQAPGQWAGPTARGPDVARLLVIIPARNESLRISPLLTSLAAQTVPPREILVVDDNSSDDTAGVATGSPCPGRPAPPRGLERQELGLLAGQPTEHGRSAVVPGCRHLAGA